MTSNRISDLSLRDYDLTDRTGYLKEIYFRALPEICIERCRLVTSYHVEHGLFDQAGISVLDKAKAYRYALENRAPVVFHSSICDKNMQAVEIDDRSLFAGSTTSKFKGAPLYPEFLALTLWPELRDLPTRKSNPFYIKKEEIDVLNQEIFPRWMDHNILELARKRCYQENLAKYRRGKYAPELKLLERLVFFLAGKPQCISLTVVDFSRLVNQGLSRLIDEARNKMELSSKDDQKEFFASIAEVLKGIVSYAKNLSIRARKMAERTSDPARKQELTEMAGIYDRVPENQAGSFREALTGIWICWTALHIENPNVGLSLGRLDQLLCDLFSNDLENRTLTIEQAIELLCCLWLKIGDHVPAVPETAEQLFGGTGANQAITVGGVDCQENNAVNDLTYVMLRAIELLKLRDPNLNARYFSGINPKAYLRRLCEANLNTGATPAIHNDKAVIRSLTSKGETIEQARDYGVIGCVEPGSNGRFYGNPAAIYLNLPAVLELTLYNGRHRHTGKDQLISKETGDPNRFKSFDDLKKAFEQQAAWLIDRSVNVNNLLGKIHQDHYPTPILSAFFEGPLDKGQDLTKGGAAVNSSGVTLIGIADTADSLSAIQHWVFEKQSLSIQKLLEALDDDFEKDPVLQSQLANPDQTPKYGNEHPAADANLRWILRFFNDLLWEKWNYRGGRYRLGCWTMTTHAGYGRLTKALPNGRKAHDNFSSGITPVSGVTPHLTKALNSVASLPVEYLANGFALNIKYTPKPASREKLLDNFASVVEGYFGGGRENPAGGLEIQFNVTNHETFVDAIAHPEKYPELLVRVSGYTAYFKDLNSQMQKEIIDRTEYDLLTGKAVPFDPYPLPTRP